MLLNDERRHSFDPDVDFGKAWEKPPRHRDKHLGGFRAAQRLPRNHKNSDQMYPLQDLRSYQFARCTPNFSVRLNHYLSAIG
jgi:hypothetical protein